MSDRPARNAAAVLYADNHLVVVDKPAGLVVHPTYRNADGTLLDILRQLMPDPPSIVGRLDRLTSGIVVVARNSAVHASLQRAWAAPDCRKEYLAVVHGAVAAGGEIDLRVRVSEEDRRRVVASRDVGAPSVTQFEPLARTDGPSALSLLRCRAVSGRRHQIRVHLAARGWPIVGDPTYGSPVLDRMVSGLTGAVQPRQALHAWRLRLTHPISRMPLRIVAPVPRDLEPLLRVFALDPLAFAS